VGQFQIGGKENWNLVGQITIGDAGYFSVGVDSI
jgi:hypothetical protein